jgi:hypothetical protein
MISPQRRKERKEKQLSIAGEGRLIILPEA